MIKVTIGDSLHAYGSQGLGLDYAVRLEVQMQDSVDGDLLRKAVDLTARRYPYLLLRPCCNEAELYYEENAEPVVLLNTDQKITLASAQTNGHVWAVCYKGNRIDLDIYHGIADGTGMYMVLSTLLYYYCHDRYGVTDHTGIRTLEDAIEQNESVDPQDHFPQIDLSKFPAPALRGMNRVPLHRNTKIYMNSKGVLYNYYISNNLPIYNIEDINYISFEDFCDPVPSSCCDQIKKFYSEEYNIQNAIVEWNEIYDSL